MTTWDQLKGVTKFEPSLKTPGLQMDLHINVPFDRMLDSILQQVKAGVLKVDDYYALLDDYERVLSIYRSAKV